MRSKHIQWLYQELPALVAAGVLPSDAAERLREHYGEVAPESTVRERVTWQRVLLVIFGVFGASLVASGILLLLAHNWDQMSRPTRVVFAFAPLLAGQVLACFALLRKRDSTAWCESTAIFLAVSVGGCIALVGQIYHLPADPRAFLTAWALLILPLVYTHRATLVAILYMGLTLAWIGEGWREQETAPLFWLFAIALAPFLFAAYRRNPRGAQTQILAWFFCPWIALASVFITRSDIPWMTPTHIALVFAAMLLAGLALGKTPASIPFRALGFVGLAIELLAFTFDDVFPGTYRDDESLSTLLSIHHYGVLLLTAALVAFLTLRVYADRRWVLLWVAAPVAIFVATFAAAHDVEEELLAWLFNGYVFLIGLEAVLRGSRDKTRNALVGGVGLLAMLGLVRFFDSNLSFVLRGVVFVVIGIAFIAGNVYLLRRDRGESSS